MRFKLTKLTKSPIRQIDIVAENGETGRIEKRIDDDLALASFKVDGFYAMSTNHNRQ